MVGAFLNCSYKSQMLTSLEKMGAENVEDPLNKILKDSDWDQYPPENMTWKCCIFDTKKP